MTMPPYASGIGEAPDVVSATRRTIPFDYLFDFELLGEQERVVDRTVTVSVEAPFTAVAIGYGVIPRAPVVFGPDEEDDFQNPGLAVGAVPIARRAPLAPPVNPARARRLGEISMGAVLTSLARSLRDGAVPPGLARPITGRRPSDITRILRAGIRISDELAPVVELGGDQRQYDADQLGRLFQEIVPEPDDIQFLYALFDDGSGRAFQSAPILNTAGLGIADGDRPFRYFATPITFEPRSTIRISVTEKSDYAGELHIALHGYRVLGEAGTPTGRARLRGNGARRR